jgi:hypothetical protein
MESFDISDTTVKFGNSVKIDGKDYTINPIALIFYNNIRTSATMNMLYTSNNSRLFSSIDYMTNNGDEYSTNPIIPYHIYYNLVPKSLDFELLIPFIPKNFKTTMSICGNDLINGCSENNLIPFVFPYKKDIATGKIKDPLFEIDDVEKVKNIQVKVEEINENEDENENVENENENVEDKGEENTNEGEIDDESNENENFETEKKENVETEKKEGFFNKLLNLF